MVAVPETAGVHWKTCSGAVPELPQLPASALVPLVAPLKVPPWAGMTAGLVQSPASAPENSPAWPWQTATPSRLQRPSMLRRHARGRPPAATHAAISSRHAFRHCREGDAASAERATCSAASSASSDANPRVFGRPHIVNLLEPPRAALRDDQSGATTCNHRTTRRRCAVLGAAGADVDVGLACARPVRGTRARSVPQGLVPSKTEIANTAMLVGLL